MVLTELWIIFSNH